MAAQISRDSGSPKIFRPLAITMETGEPTSPYFDRQPVSGICSESTAGFSAVQFGVAGDVPMQADFDGDGRADIAVFRPSNKVGITCAAATEHSFRDSLGQAMKKPVPAIYILIDVLSLS
jgi:hypothetical protein